jgi:predicted nucleic acid-binding protein
MTVVIDASAAVGIALNKGAAQAFGKRIDEADLVLAPDTFPAEVTNVFWKYGNLSSLPLDTCRTGISYCLELVDDFIGTQYVWREVLAN